MTDQRFYNSKGPFSIAELAQISDCTVAFGDESALVQDVAPLDHAEPGCISVFHNAKYADALASTQADAIILSEEHLAKAPKGKILLVSESPNRSFAKVASHFFPHEKKVSSVHETAVIADTAEVGEGVCIGPYAVIGKDVVVGNHVSIGAHTVIGKGCTIGEGTEIDPHVTVSHTIIGRNVRIKAGARLGQKGFGFIMDDKGAIDVPQLGRLIVEDGAEVGSNATVDRGSGRDTVIGQGTRIDNLVQVAHNVHFGKGCVMVAQSGVSGSTQFGDYVIAAGQVGIVDHLKIGTGARLAAQSGVMSDVEPGAVLCGAPAVPIKTFYRQVAVLQRITKDFGKFLKMSK